MVSSDKHRYFLVNTNQWTMRFPSCTHCIKRSNEDVNLGSSVQAIEPVALGSHPTFGTCARSLRGAVLGNVFHP